jgi:WD40 repeat protein
VAGDRLLAVARDATFVFALPELQRLATLPAATYAMLDRDGSIVLADGAALRRYQLDGTFAMIRAGESQPLTRLGDGSLATGMELIGASATRGFAPGIAAELIAPLDATHVITGGFDRVLRIARLDVGRPLAVLDAAGATEQLIASPSGTRTVSLARDGAIELWDTGRLREPRTIAELAAPIQRIVVGRSGIAAWLHSMAGNTVAVLDSTNARVGLVPGWPVGYRPGGDELVVNDGGRLFVYAARDASQLRVLDDPSAIQTAAFSSSGALLATASAGQVTLRDARTWQVIRSLAIPRSDATAIAIDDAGHVIIGHGDGAMERYDATTGPTGARLAGHGAHVEDMALRGDRLVTISWDRTTRAWDIGSGASRGVLLPSSGHSLALSPSGRWLATVDGSPVVNLWDAERGALVEQVAAARPLDAAAFLGEDQLVVGGGDGRLEQIELGERDVDTRELARLAGAMGWQLVDGRVAWRRVD